MKKLSDVVDNEAVKIRKFNTLKRKVNSLEKKILDAITSMHINQYCTDKQNLEKKIRDVDKIPDTRIQVTTTNLNTKIHEVENKIPDTCGLVTTTALSTQISEVENKIPNAGHLIKKTDYELI